MNTNDDPHRAVLIDATTIDDLARARIVNRVRAEVDQLRQIDSSARVATAPPAAGARRIRARLARGEPRNHRGWVRWGLGVAVAATIGAAVAVGWPSSDVQLAIEGAGQVTGTRSAPVVELADGRLDATVTPNRGTRLEIRTDEATVTVVGTAFTVDRKLLATEVTVSHGLVDVRCVGQAQVVQVGGGASHRCLPGTAAGLLRRVVALGTEDPDALREAIDAGLAVADSAGPVRAELLAHDVRLKARAGDSGAVAAAEVYLATGETVRRTEMVVFVAGERYAREGCGAVAAVERAVAADPGTVLAVGLASCVVDADPERARALLDGVGDPGPWRWVYDEVRARIGP